MYTPVLNNLAVIAVFVAFYVAYGHVSSLHSATEGQLVFIGAGTTLGVVLQGLGNVPFMRGLGKYRWTLSISHPSVKKLARLSVFVIGYVVANQVGYVVVQYLAEKQVGGYSAYVAAFTFYMLPHGLFAVSVITALLPGMSGHATNERWDDYRRQLSIGIRATFLLILPAAIGYFALGTSVVRLLLQHGVMHEQDTELVASTLRYFVIGLVAFSLFQLLLRAYYALQDTKTPFVVNCAAVGLNIVADVVLFHYLKVEGLALGHAIAYTFGVVVLAVLLARRVGGIDGAHVVRSATRIAISATGMGVVVWVTAHLLGSAVGTGGLIPDATLVVVPVVVGVAAYVGLAILLGVEELSFVRGVVTRRFAR